MLANVVPVGMLRCWANVAVVVLDADMLSGLARLVSPAADR